MNQSYKINYKSDVAFDESIVGLDGQAIDPMSLDWEIQYRTSGYQRFTASNNGGVLTNAIIDPDSGELVVVFARHGLPAGRLIKELHVEIDNEIFPQGIQNNYVPVITEYELWDGPTDYSIASPSQLLLSYAKGDRGDAARIVSVSAQTLPAGAQATVENTGTEQDASLLFGLPKGDAGRSAYESYMATHPSATISENEYAAAPVDAAAEVRLLEARVSEAETLRKQSETVRSDDERARIAAEGARSEAEKARAAAEQQRVSDFSAMKTQSETVIDSTEKAAATALEAAAAAASVIVEIEDSAAVIDVKGNHSYLCGTLTSLALQSVEDSPRESVIRFKSGGAPTTLTLPATLEVVGWMVPQANHSYEISIANNRAVIAYFETL